MMVLREWIGTSFSSVGNDSMGRAFSSCSCAAQTSWNEFWLFLKRGKHLACVSVNWPSDRGEHYWPQEATSELLDNKEKAIKYFLGMAMLYVTSWVAPGKDKVAQNFFSAISSLNFLLLGGDPMSLMIILNSQYSWNSESGGQIFFLEITCFSWGSKLPR